MYARSTRKYSGMDPLNQICTAKAPSAKLPMFAYTGRAISSPAWAIDASGKPLAAPMSTSPSTGIKLQRTPKLADAVLAVATR